MAAFKCIVLLLMLVYSIYGSEIQYRICAKKTLEDQCSQLLRSLEVECQYASHGIDCVQSIQQGKSDFGRLTAEEALIAANFVQDIVVIGEIRSDAIFDDALYSTVILVKQDYTGAFTNLRGKKFCHPGFKYIESVSELLLKEFERTVLKANNADACSSAVGSDTMVEKELKAVFEFFGPSCRPGPWSEGNYNGDFYKRYSRLCELCESQEKCSVPNGEAPFMYSLKCLLKVDGGDVALTTLNTVKEYFDKPENSNKKSLYRYLCPDGSVKTLDSPCAWSKQPWNLIVANRKAAAEIKTSIEQRWLPNNVITVANGTSGSGFSSLRSAIEDPLKGLFFTEKGSNKILIINEVPLNKYIQGYRTIPTTGESTMCGQQIRWCTVSQEEQEKCLWLAQASLDHALQPVIDCVQSLNKLTCLDDIQKDKADVVTSDAHYGYIARKKGLTPIMYPETAPRNFINTLIVIKNKDAPLYQSFEDLKGKKACFPEYGGIEWLSFINAGRDYKALSTTTCDYGSLISEFLGDSCIPGAHDVEHTISASVDKEKLCRLCLPIPTGTATTCNTDNTNVYYGNVGALKCLKDIGDFAVITKGDYQNINPSEYRVVCKNGTLASGTGFNVDSSCSLSVTVDSEVVIKRKQPNKDKDIELVLLNFERRFGTDGSKAFEIFNIFNNTLDLLFEDSTLGLVDTNTDNVYVKNYANLFVHTDKCIDVKTDQTPTDKPDGSNTLQISLVTITTTLTVVFLSKLLF